MSKLVLFGLAVVSIVASPAHADPPIGTRLGSRTSGDVVRNEATAARKAHDYAQCIAHLRAPSARAFLAALTPEEGAKRHKAMSREIECDSKSADNDFVEGHMLSFSVDLLRGMLAEVFVLDHRAQAAALPPLPRQNIYKRGWFAASGRSYYVDEMATCVAEVNPSGTLALIAAPAYSNGEGAAFAALVPTMGPCLAIGAKLQAGRQALRAALADALYQRMYAPAEATVVSAGAQK